MPKNKFDLGESLKPVTENKEKQNQVNIEEKKIDNLKVKEEYKSKENIKPKRVVPNANDERRDAITQIRFQPSVKEMAIKKATSEGISLAEYLHRLIIEDNM